jgi:hypothetical protein
MSVAISLYAALWSISCPLGANCSTAKRPCLIWLDHTCNLVDVPIGSYPGGYTLYR